MGWKEEKLLTRKIMIGLASTVLGLMPLDAAGVDVGIAAAEAVPDVRLPEGHNKVDGDVTVNAPINTEGHAVMDIVQNSDKAIIDWNTFNVGKDATVNFIHLKTENNITTLNTAASTLNRVTGGQLSEIAGTINSVGTFILINPNGAVFSKGSEVNAAGIIVSTADIKNDNYKNGNLWFEQNKNQNANIIMDGTMNAETGTDKTTNSGANKVLKHLTDLKDEKTSLEAAAKDIAAEEAAAAAQAKLDTLQATAGNLLMLNVTELKPATGFALGANGIKLVADGDIFVGANAAITATAKTDISGDTTVGVEEFEVDGGGTSRTGSIVLRADQNADDVAVYDGAALENYAGITDVVTYDDEGKAIAAGSAEKGGRKTAKVYLSDELKGQAKIKSQHIGIYYDADIVGDIKGTDTARVVPDGAASDKFTQKNYKEHRESSTNYTDKIENAGELDTSKGESYGKTVAMLVNDVYQLKAIDDSEYGNMSGSYALGTGINAAETKNWNHDAGSDTNKGFDPIGDAVNTFKGSFTGSGGSNGYSISNLTINRPDKNNVGLFAKVDGGSVWSLTLIDPSITGKNFVGGAAGEGDKAHFEGVTIRKSADADKDAVNISGKEGVGGVVGSMVNSSIRSSVNETVINGVTETGGIVGVAVGHRTVNGNSVGYTIDRSKNKGSVTGSGDYTGGLVGLLEGKTGDEAIISESMNNGTISGQDYTGGIVGAMYGTGENTVSVKTTYNTNEGTTLGTKISEESTGEGTSDFGRVTGHENVGGLAGYMNNAEIETAYNAGNVTGERNVGGVAGKMEGSSSISKAYNADNNTVLMTAAPNQTITSAENNAYYGFTVTATGHSYQYDQSSQQWVRDDGEELTTEKVLEEAPESKRTYNNRLAYRDAVISGNENVGGVVGDMKGGRIEQVYNAGRVKAADGTASDTIGDFGGIRNDGTVADSFYVTDRQDGATGITNLGRAFGDASSDGITAKNLYEATNISSVTANGVDWAKDGTKIVNQNDDWMIYSNSSAPLLKHFMKRININRQYEYDGTTHNLITTDVDNFYGGAFFEGEGKGRYVTTDGIDTVSGYNSADWKVKSGTTNAADINGKSSIYTYENADMWSPQHGYFVDPNAAVIIVPRTLNAEVTGEKTYGQNAVSGAVIVASDASADDIKNAQNDGANYALRFVNDTTGKTGFVSGEDAYTHEGAKGVLTSGGAALTVDEDGKVRLSGGGYSDDTYSLDAGTYTEAAKFTNPELKSDHNNYKIVYTDKLTVNKADLYFTAEGSREYGEANKASDFHYTAAAVGDGTNYTLNNGALKFWDNKADNIDALITNRGTAAVTVKSETEAKTGKTTSDTNITKASWVKDTEDKKYTLAKGSFESGGKSELISKNYNLIFVDSVTDDAVADKQGKSTYAITPVDLYYNIVGTRKYGDAADKAVYDITAADASKLKNGDKLSDIETHDGLNSFAAGVVEQLEGEGKINTEHVKRDASGKVTFVYNEALETEDTSHIEVDGENPNYNLKAKNLQYTVTPAELIYKADDNTKVYGNTAMDKAFSGSFTTGFVNGDSEDGVYVAGSTEKVKASEAAGTAAYSTKIDAAKNVTDAKTDAGTYNGAIQASGLKLNDYEIKYEAGNATVTPRDINIEYTVSDKTKVYGETNPTLSADSDINVTAGFVNGDTFKNNEYAFTGMPEKNQKADVGTYELDVKDKDWQTAVGGNYKVNAVSANRGTLTVTPKEISLTVDDKSRVYGNDNPVLTGTITGMLDGDTLKKGISYKTDADEKSHVGDYGISVDYGDKEHAVYWQDILGKNYTLKDANVTNGSLHITPRSISYKADDATREAGSDKEPVLSGGFVLGKKGEDTGFMSWDLPKLEAYNLTSGDFSTSTTKESEPMDYPDDIKVNYSKEDIISRFGADADFSKDYVVVDVLPGTMHVIVKRGLAPSFSSSPKGNSPHPGVVPVSDDTAVIDGQGLDMPKEAVAPRPVDDESKNHPNVPFRPADDAEERSDAENDIIWKEVATDNSMESEDGGEIERERRGSLRFLTIEDTGINVKPAALSANTITIDASSRSDGGGTVVIENVHDDIRVIGTKPLLKGTTIDTLKESAVIRGEAKGKRFQPVAEMSDEERAGIFSEMEAEGIAVGLAE